jgi:hypothetical protein
LDNRRKVVAAIRLLHDENLSAPVTFIDPDVGIAARGTTVKGKIVIVVSATADRPAAGVAVANPDLHDIIDRSAPIHRTALRANRFRASEKYRAGENSDGKNQRFQTFHFVLSPGIFRLI